MSTLHLSDSRPRPHTGPADYYIDDQILAMLPVDLPLLSDILSSSPTAIAFNIAIGNSAITGIRVLFV